MAKRKRLTPATLKPSSGLVSGHASGELETKSMPGTILPGAGTLSGPTSPVSSRPPIAQVAGDASSQAALEEVTQELQAARSEGRLVQALPLHAIKADHLVRDRMVIDEVEMGALKASLLVRGQQTPIEVVDLGQGDYGLISGWRRLNALSALSEETNEPRFSLIQALIKPVNSVSDSYVAMVEENEVRANLSYYERARLAAEAARLGVYPTPQRAVQALFASASSSKRSKIVSFLSVHNDLHGALAFPAAIPERLGLALASALEKNRTFGSHLKDLLRKAKLSAPQEERVILERAVTRAQKGSLASAGGARPKALLVAPGITLEARQGRVVLSGKSVTAELQDALKDWLQSR